MKKYSRCAVYTLEKFTNNEGQSFYEATLVENTYNPKIPYMNKWEMTFYKCQIYTDLELEVADFSLDLDKNQYSFVNISNPEKSIIRVLDFEYVNRTIWKGKEKLQDTTANNKKVDRIKRYIAIHDCEYDKAGYKSEERKIADFEKRLEQQKQVNNELRREIRQLKKELISRDEELLKKNEKINNVELTYNPKYKPENALPTESDMITFDDI